MKRFKDLFENNHFLRIPSYQRAYAWEEKQLGQFISDMLEMNGKDYYFGHFILEKTDKDCEVIDGQQRLTTLILFLIVCRFYRNNNPAYSYIDQFETVSYDKSTFKKILDCSVNEINEQNEFQTASSSRMFDALKYFIKMFKSEKLKVHAIDKYIKTFTEAHISVHITEDKAVAVQIFELQNTRGINLNLIEKVKAKLMKAIYLAKEDGTDVKITDIQDTFAKIYQQEEQISLASFRGDLSLDEILLYQLRMVDDGSKLKPQNKNEFHSPSAGGNREDEILKFIDDRLKNTENVVSYTTNLTEKFAITVDFFSNELPRLDMQNHLIGDVLICEKSISTQLFVLIRHKFVETFETFFQSQGLLSQWEKLIYTRDFHDRYYRQWYRDDFEQLYWDISSKEEVYQMSEVFDRYLSGGFRPDLMENRNLQETVINYLKNNEIQILNNAFRWWQAKMAYTLYKYERNIGADMEMLRKIMKAGRSIEHILPQEWSWEWIGERDSNNISEKGKETSNRIARMINGVGNLLLITPSENSSISNSNPKDKFYSSCLGGSYDEHNKSQTNWENHENWESIIENRGRSIVSFMLNYFSFENKA